MRGGHAQDSVFGGFPGALAARDEVVGVFAGDLAEEDVEDAAEGVFHAAKLAVVGHGLEEHVLAAQFGRGVVSSEVLLKRVGIMGGGVGCDVRYG